MVLNGKCVTVVAFTGLHFRAFYLLTFAASHDLKETIDKDYCECGMPLETVRESEAPLKELRSNSAFASNTFASFL